MQSKTSTNTIRSKHSTKSPLKNADKEPNPRGYHLGVVHHFSGFGPIEKPVHFISLIASKQYDDNVPSGKASIQAWSDGKGIYFKDGILSPDDHYHSARMGSIWCPILTKKLRSTKEPREACATPEYVPADCRPNLRYHFGRGDAEGPCDTFHLLRLWNQFEKQRLDWEARHMLIAGSSKPDEPLVDFQRRCAQAGLRLGEKTPYDKQFRDLDKKLCGWESLTWLNIAIRSK